MAESPRLAGFAVRGFRDIREPAFLGPWATLNILGGVNNAGKSALLDAIKLCVRMDRGRLANQLPQRERLDTPQVLDGGAPPQLEVGYYIDFGDREPAAGLIEILTGRDMTGHDTMALSAVLNDPAFQASNDGRRDEANGIWLWQASGNAEELPQSVQNAIEAQADQRRALNQVTQSGYSGTVSWGGVLGQLRTKILGPETVVHVPPDRKIVASEHRESSLPSTTGEGLPGMLLGLLAPPAEDFYSARDRLARINDFVRRVLDEPSAELLVPHNAQTVHVAIDGRVLPLTHLGAGIEQLILLASICTEYSNSLILMEEPDLYLHPTLQRQLLQHLQTEASNTYVIATHSAAMLDTDYANVFKIDWNAQSGTTSTLVTSPRDRASLAIDLGFRASDLVQANAVIWIEGPSDRIYLKRWLSLTDPELVEGIHYSFVMYGGRLGEHLTAGTTDGAGRLDQDIVDRFIEITRINRHSAFVMDSDLTSGGEPLAGYKSRISRELAESGSGFAWVTCGTMIENYVDPGVFGVAYRSVHSRSRATYTGGLLENPFAGGAKQPNKLRIAHEVVDATSAVPDRGKLRSRLKDVVALVRQANGMKVP